MLAIAGCEARVARPPEITENVVAGPLLGRTGAVLVVSEAASRVRVVFANLPGVLYRITTPAGAGLTPRVTRRAGQVRVSLQPSGGHGPDELTIVLNRGVVWDLRLPAGAGEQRLDLSRGRVSRLSVGASGLIEVRLPQPYGTVPLVVTGGVGTLAVTAPRGVPLRLHLVRGARSALTPWTADEEIPPATTFAPAVWPTARDRYSLRTRSTVGILSLRRK
ncbi:hypothetical protein Aab01nite_28970 [Paractinoplanes abujensis]|uniref:Uncharacterized protein n=1 Tax=Paractinoplanes abujensis TaxID=882441 RepID=A0A7W7D0S6_9ACTN|nr:hypothetical protein [Actinoplanes abujensis]MBB4698207.1 hypothetical protein [Actinoplanes abujensis]GID19307.1 hypothetical protein Aab01nite_28970 [Actinoplanes abujensis]